jgi:hypothetical protein
MNRPQLTPEDEKAYHDTKQMFVLKKGVAKSVID